VYKEVIAEKDWETLDRVIISSGVTTSGWVSGNWLLGRGEQ